ncbi:DUF7344 domain-containing protein [Natronorubrum texcoconense]|uniref:DUF7344 domain-containing protein n=1 Tax=Natronorubrum texcoconense TaxID=1095776 RepID=A0A1G8VGF0_9EURY|nr:hypothetical protein [Natronorubrum texcoconense]SDJ64230.1 hypothetical protein SAMN04515672_1296 [Natronorubrum texcoconense]
MDQRDAFRVLASADRQFVLHELVDRDGSVSVDELSQAVAARRHRVSTEAVSDAQADRAQVRLVHLHFPQLMDRNIITIDWADDEVSLADTEHVDVLLDAAEELEPWPPSDMPGRYSW